MADGTSGSRAGHLLAAAAAAVPLLIMAAVGSRPVDLSSEAHFWPVVTAGGTAACVAIGLTMAGVRGRDGRVILLGTAFSTTTALLDGARVRDARSGGRDERGHRAGRRPLDSGRRRAARPHRPPLGCAVHAGSPRCSPSRACSPPACSASAPSPWPSRRSSRWCRRPAARPRSPCSCSGSAACWSSPTGPCGRTR